MVELRRSHHAAVYPTHFYVWAKGAFADECDLGPRLPAAILRARELWARMRRRDFPLVVSLLRPYLRAWLIPINVNGSEALMLARDVAATRFRICAVEFAAGRALPSLTLEASFVLKLKRRIDQAFLEAWEERHSYLDNGVSFDWIIDGTGSTIEPWSVPLDNHCGLGLTLED